MSNTENVIERDRLLKMKEVATYLGFSYDTVKDMVAARTLTCYVVIGNRKRFVKRHLDNWIEQRVVLK